MHSYECDVAVIGGGLAGGSAAYAFARQGCSVRLFERRDLARDPNRGDLMHSPTVELTRRIGIFDLLIERGAVALRGMETVDPSGELSLKTKVDNSYVLNHSELESAFLDAAQAHGAVVQPDMARSIVRASEDPVDGWLVDTDNGTTRARFLVGADGAGSFTRRSLGITLVDDHKYDNCIAVLHADCPSWLDPEHGWQLIHPDGAVFILPTTPLGRVRLVVLIRADEARDWLTATEEELAQRLGKRHPSLEGLTLTKRGGSHVYRLTRTHAERYSVPHAALAGDAAHTIHSMGGQGLNIAIQDSVKLAELVAPVLTDPTATEDALAAALEEYEAVRRPINQEAIDRADFAQNQARPGTDAFRTALDFYRKAAADPTYMQKNRPKFGGREE